MRNSFLFFCVCCFCSCQYINYTAKAENSIRQRKADFFYNVFFTGKIVDKKQEGFAFRTNYYLVIKIDTASQITLENSFFAPYYEFSVDGKMLTLKVEKSTYKKMNTNINLRKESQSDNIMFTDGEILKWGFD